MKALLFLERYFERALLTLSLLSMATILFLQVIMRYFLRAPFVWSEEISRYMLVWSAIIGVSLAVRERKHISVDFLPILFGERSHRWFSLISLVSVLAFSCIMVTASIPLIERLAAIGQTSPALGIPMWMVYSAVPVGFGLTILRTIQALFVDLFVGRPETANQGDL